jgi:hypothetical protein
MTLRAAGALRSRSSASWSGVRTPTILEAPIAWDKGDIFVLARPGLGHNLNEDLARRLAPGAEYSRLTR